MKNFKTIFILIGLIITICISFVVGLFVGQKNAPKNDLAISKIYGQTFYANIESIKQYNDGSFHLNVKGLEVNDKNYRGDFTFKVTDSIDMTWQGQKIGISDLKEGDIISITFADEIITSISPTPLQEVVRVQLLRDKKSNIEINDKVTTIDLQTTGLVSETPMKEYKKYTLNQEEIYEIFNIIDSLKFDSKTCDGLPTYYIQYNSKEENGFVVYGIEIFDNEYHITSQSNGEATLSKEQKEQIDKIISKLDN